MEERVVKVGFGADDVQASSIPTSDSLNEVLTEVRALLELSAVVQVYLGWSARASRFPPDSLTCIRTPRYDQISGCTSSASLDCAFTPFVSDALARADFGRSASNISRPRLGTRG